MKKLICLCLILALALSVAYAGTTNGNFDGDSSTDNVWINFKEYWNGTSKGVEEVDDLMEEGWEVDTSLTSEYCVGAYSNFRIVSYGIQAGIYHANSPIYSDIAFDVHIPTTNVYSFSLAGFRSDYGSKRINIYVDDKYMGFYDCYDNGSNTQGDYKAMNHIALDEGYHKVIIRSVESSQGLQQFISGFKFTEITAPTIQSTELTAEKTTINTGETVSITPTVLMSNGVAYDFNNNADNSENSENYITFTQNPAGLLSVANGKITGIDGGTTTLTMSGKVDGVSFTDSLDITVNPIATTFELDFTGWGYAGSPIGLVTLAANGWEIDKARTAPTAMTDETTPNVGILRFQSSSGLNFYTDSRSQVIDSDMTLKVNVPADGYYEFSMQALKSKYSARLGVYIDDTYVGDYQAYNEEDTFVAGEMKTLNSVALTRGVHTVTFRSLDSMGIGLQQWIQKIKFTVVDALPTVSSVTFASDKTQLLLDETATVTAVVLMSDSTSFNFGTKYDKSLDTTNCFEIASSNPDIISYENGVVTAHAAGSAALTAHVVVNGIAQTAAPIMYTVTDVDAIHYLTLAPDGAANYTLRFTHPTTLAETDMLYSSELEMYIGAFNTSITSQVLLGNIVKIDSAMPPLVVFGRVAGVDSEISVLDAVLTQRMANSASTPSMRELISADVNADSNVDMQDAQAIAEYYARGTSLPILAN